MNRWPAVGLAVGIVRNGSLELYGHGVADIASSTPITGDTVFRIGSITKTFTAIAVLQLWEQGLVDLDAPANDYLPAYKLVPAKAWLPAGDRATAADLHAGIPEAVHAADLLHLAGAHSTPVPPSRASGSESGCRRWPSTTVAVSGWWSSLALPSRTATTGSPRSARWSRT